MSGPRFTSGDASGSLFADVEPGSDEEVSLRGEWLAKLMFGWMRDAPETRPYEEWLTAQGFRLV